MIIETTDLKRNFKVGSETIQALKGVNLSIDKESPISEIALFKKPPPVCEYTNEKERNANTIRIFLKTLDLNN